ncbi:unnamed protein product [Ostreobium quekettii]|uniref:Uncharacterized protein n=1 Tax=Ostreobium quekettii TaxID=121088 RepID=A0A8S1J4W2_9CHLO|nr:unnamed protein product [Ostreobium quekettii]
MTAERKVVRARSCLSECLRYRNGTDGGAAGGQAPAQGGPDGRTAAPAVRISRSSSVCWSRSHGRPGSGDVGFEIQQILSSDCETDRSAVFGCSPPMRALNPLSRDGQFRRCAAIQQPQGFGVPDLLPAVKGPVDACAAVLPHA